MTDPNAHDDLPPPAPPDEPVGCITVFGTVGLSLVIVVVNVIVCPIIGIWVRTLGLRPAHNAWMYGVISLVEMGIALLALRPIDSKMSRDAVATRAGIAAGCAVSAGLNTLCWATYG